MKYKYCYVLVTNDKNPVVKDGIYVGFEMPGEINKKLLSKGETPFDYAIRNSSDAIKRKLNED